MHDFRTFTRSVSRTLAPRWCTPALLLAAALLSAGPAAAAPVQDCGSTGICYCVNSDFKPVIDAQVAKLRAIIAAERAKGKAIGYMSVPLSTLGGGTLM